MRYNAVLHQVVAVEVVKTNLGYLLKIELKEFADNIDEICERGKSSMTAQFWILY